MSGDEKSVTKRWLSHILPTCTSSGEAAKKNSCAEIFNLPLTREELIFLRHTVTSSLKNYPQNMETTRKHEGMICKLTRILLS